jgi:hypothetical protein
VDFMAITYAGLCDNYCAAIGKQCVGAWEEQGDSCNVEYLGGCEDDFGSTSDAICECSPDSDDSQDTTIGVESSPWKPLKFADESLDITISRFVGIGTNDGPVPLLDLSGKFIYAVDFGGAGVTLAGIHFTSDVETDGINVSASERLQNFNPSIEIGEADPSGDSVPLQQLLRSSLWSGYPDDIRIEMSGLVAANHYRLNLIFAESCPDCERIFDIIVDGRSEITDYRPRVCDRRSQTLDLAQASMVTFEFTASHDHMLVELTANGAERIVYLGCFAESATHDDISAERRRVNSIDSCAKHCYRYTVFGVQEGGNCFCSDTYGSLGPSSACTTPCRANEAQICGGHFANSVYRLPSRPANLLRYVDPAAVYDPFISALTLQHIEHRNVNFFEKEFPLSPDQAIDVQVRSVHLPGLEQSSAPHLSWVLHIPEEGLKDSTVGDGVNSPPDGGGIVLDWTPPNDACANALTIGVGETQFDTTFATNSATDSAVIGDSCGTTTISNDIWYLLRPSISSCYTISTCETVNFNSILMIAEVPANAATVCDAIQDRTNGTNDNVMHQLYCNDDGAGCNVGSSYLQIELERGSTYVIRLGGQSMGKQGKPSAFCGPGTIAVQATCQTCTLHDYNQVRLCTTFKFKSKSKSHLALILLLSCPRLSRNQMQMTVKTALFRETLAYIGTRTAKLAPSKEAVRAIPTF